MTARLAQGLNTLLSVTGGGIDGFNYGIAIENTCRLGEIDFPEPPVLLPLLFIPTEFKHTKVYSI